MVEIDYTNEVLMNHYKKQEIKKEVLSLLNSNASIPVITSLSDEELDVMMSVAGEAGVINEAD